MVSLDVRILFQAFVATSTNASTVSDTSFDCVLFDFMNCLCDFCLIGVVELINCSYCFDRFHYLL